MPRKVKILLSILIPVTVVFLLCTTLGLIYFIHDYLHPAWTEEVKDLAMEYLQNDEEILATYGENAVFLHDNIQYNPQTRRSTVYIKVNGDAYAVYVEYIEYKYIYIVTGYERIELE